MPKAADFRTYAFDVGRVDTSGKDVGRQVYWKLYAIENLLRIVTHSILTVQVAPDWWTKAVDPKMQARIADRMKDYAARPWYSTPGKHEVYYTFLSDISKIITPNAHLFQPLIPDIDQWIARIEQIRLPRNIVGHMNWLTVADRKRIDVFYSDVQHLAQHVGTELAKTGGSLLIP